MEKVKGGWSMDRVLFSEQARKVFDIAVDHRRVGLTLHRDAERGVRFKDDKAILARLESMFDEVEFMANVGPCIDKALQDAGESDYWYRHDKDYEGPEMAETEIAEGEDDE